MSAARALVYAGLQSILCFVTLAQLLPSPVAGRLTRMTIEANRAGALCNDFTEARYYLEQLPQAKDWVIFFEGGGGCSDNEQCNNRYRNNATKVLMSSYYLPNSVNGSNVLSTDPGANPLFHNYNHVLVPYCSQDAFLANSTKPRATFEFHDNPEASNFVFRGRVIFHSVILNLLQNYSLANASNIVLAGSSAGGIGIVNNLDWVKDTLSNATPHGQDSPELAVIVDSAWFIPFDGYYAFNYSRETAVSLDIPFPACNDFRLGYPCCTSLACLLMDHDYELSTPLFSVASLYDIFTLRESLRSSLENIMFENDNDLLRLFNTYGALIYDSLVQSFKLQNKLSIFAPSCTQHVYLATSSLWASNELLNQTVDSIFREGVFTLTNPVSSGHWDLLKVNLSNSTSISLHSALQSWYPSKEQTFYTDTCVGPACGNCPSRVSLEPNAQLWPYAAHIAVLTLSALMSALPVTIKLFLYLYMKGMLYYQKVYAYNLKNTQKYKYRFPNAVHAVSVSCTGLNYLVDTVDSSKRDADGDNTHKDQTQQFSKGHFKCFALASTLFPCCKPCQASCMPRYDSTTCDCESGVSCSTHNHSQDKQTSSPLKKIRPDSGISSSIQTNHKVESSFEASEDVRDSFDVTSVDFMLESSSTSSNTLPPNHMATKKTNVTKKTILHCVNMYVNPGELLAIMGPSGSGKTTLLDVLLGRRRTGSTQGDIFVNGVPLSKIRDWFIINTGYVRQLATSFYNELTVRENLLFSMNMQAPGNFSLTQKLERVEQVIRETGLQEQADIVVGNGIGLGLSGGQRKRLTIAVQLLSMPNIIFLDEPTSGLDSASSLDILKSLQVMANTGRAIVVTIHQPRSEIFHAFDKILLLCKGQVAFFGSPVKVWEFFRKALVSDELEERVGQVQDTILDLLKEKESQSRVLMSYEKSKEPKKVMNAVLESREDSSSPPPPTYKRYPGFWHRLVSLESRASLRQTLFTIIYLPVVYTMFGIILGSTYTDPRNALQVFSVTCLLSCSSSLFMSSIVLSLLVEPLKLFHLEHSDGISCSYELILQVFFRMSAVGALPLTVCATIVFGWVYFQHSFEVYCTILLAFLLVNQVWIAIFILLTVLAPSQAHRLCPVFAAIGGFCCGFIVPKPLMPIYYRWIFYINPSYYAYSATSVTVLNGLNIPCDRTSNLECFQTSNYASLDSFDIANVNPIAHLVVLMGMTLVIILSGIVVLELKVSGGLIKDGIVSSLYSCARRSNKDSRISSSVDTLDEVDTPVTQIRSFRRRLMGQTKGSIQNTKEMNFSQNFLERERHMIHHNFPWERPEELDHNVVDGCGMNTIFSPCSTTSRRSRVGSDGSEDVFEPIEVIKMEQEADQDVRQKQAEQKWNLRRIQIETEIQRLRQISLNRDMASRKRHSVASFGNELEDQVFNLEKKNSLPKKRYMSTANFEGDRSFELSNDGSAGQEFEEQELKLQPAVGARRKVKPPFTRACSLPTNEALFRGLGESDMNGIAVVPTLETYEEDDEESLEMMGLPPKDIPLFRTSMEHLEPMDINEIPPHLV